MFFGRIGKGPTEMKMLPDINDVLTPFSRNASVATLTRRVADRVMSSEGPGDVLSAAADLLRIDCAALTAKLQGLGEGLLLGDLEAIAAVLTVEVFELLM